MNENSCGFRGGKIYPSIDDSISEAISTYAKLIVQQKDDDLIKFLELKGYRPKRTREYMMGLKRRLAKKGLVLYCTIDTNIPPITGDGCEIIINQSWSFKIDKKEATK